VDASLGQAARLMGGATGASEPPEEPIRTENESGRDAKILNSWIFVVEPPIGIEPMTYALRACSGTLLAGSEPAPP
jgi:hypothetical protein